MKFPWHTIKIGNCIAQEKKVANSGKRTNQPRLKGRPQIIFAGERWLSARLSFHLNNHPIERCPDLRGDQLVLHSCDNGWCINPSHLSLGTQRKNCLERSERNQGWVAGRKSCHTRQGLESLARAAAARKGEKRPNSFWKTEEGRKKISEISKAGWAKNKSKRKASAKSFWNSEEGKALIKERNIKMDPKVKQDRAKKAAAVRWGK